MLGRLLLDHSMDNDTRGRSLIQELKFYTVRSVLGFDSTSGIGLETVIEALGRIEKTGGDTYHKNDIGNLQVPGLPSSSKNLADDNSLSAQLRHAQKDYHRHAHSYIIPICKQQSLITVGNIEQDIRDGDDNIEPADITDVAAKACAIAPKLFATLAYMKKGPEICAFLRDGVSDKDLPLRRMKNEKGDLCYREL